MDFVVFFVVLFRGLVLCRWGRRILVRLLPAALSSRRKSWHPRQQPDRNSPASSSRSDCLPRPASFPTSLSRPWRDSGRVIQFLGLPANSASASCGATTPGCCSVFAWSVGTRRDDSAKSLDAFPLVRPADFEARLEINHRAERPSNLGRRRASRHLKTKRAAIGR